MTAKIATYDTVSGTGTLITKENERKSFSINDWDNFDTLPSIGLLVNIDVNGSLSVQKEVVNENVEKLAELEMIKEKYINSSIANGWKLINNNDTGFVIQETVTSAFKAFFEFILYSLVFSLFIGFYGALLSLVLIIVANIGNKTTVLKGVVNKEKFIIEITKEGKPYKLLSINKEENINYNNESTKNKKLRIILVSVFIIFTIGFFIIQNYFIEIMDYINMKTNLN